MKVLIANKFGYRKGGADGYALDLADVLRSHGHEVAFFSMADKRNEDTQWKEYTVSAVNTDLKNAGWWEALRTAMRFFWSFEAAKKFEHLIRDFRPDLIHVHNLYHQISPSILKVAKRHRLPVVMTAHDFALLAPNYALYHDGRVCEITRPKNYWRAVQHRCVGGSQVKSLLCAAEMAFHDRLGAWRDNIDVIITPSEFVRQKFIDFGWPANRLVRLPHYVDTKKWQPRYSGDYVLFFGRLSEEKGIGVLIDAARNCPGVPIKIVGAGPLEKKLRQKVIDAKISGVEFVGRLDGEELREAVVGARFVVVPSVWNEPFGLVVLEAYAAGKPVIASRVGGLAELVEEGKTGFYAEPNSSQDLADKILHLWDTVGLSESLGQNARRLAEEKYSVERHYQKLSAIYDDLRRR